MTLEPIVMWRLKESAEGAFKEENTRKIKEMLEALKGVIPEIVEIRVGINAIASPAAFDVVLYSQESQF